MELLLKAFLRGSTLLDNVPPRLLTAVLRNSQTAPIGEEEKCVKPSLRGPLYITACFAFSKQARLHAAQPTVVQQSGSDCDELAMAMAGRQSKDLCRTNLGPWTCNLRSSMPWTLDLQPWTLDLGPAQFDSIPQDSAAVRRDHRNFETRLFRNSSTPGMPCVDAKQPMELTLHAYSKAHACNRVSKAHSKHTGPSQTGLQDTLMIHGHELPACRP